MIVICAAILASALAQSNAVLVDCDGEYCCTPKKDLVIIGNIRNSVFCYSDSDRPLAYGISNPQNPLDDFLVESKSRNFVISTTKTDDNLQKIAAKLAPGNYVLHVESGKGMKANRNVIIEQNLDIELIFVGSDEIQIRSNSSASEQYLVDHVNNGVDDLEIEIENAGIRKSVGVPKRRRRSTRDAIGFIKLTDEELKKMEKSQTKGHISICYHYISNVPMQDISIMSTCRQKLLKGFINKGNDASFPDIWQFMKNNWLMVVLVLVGVLTVVVIITIVCCIKKNKKKSRNESSYDYAPGASGF